MATEPTPDTGPRTSYAQLERAYIQEYLRGLGLTAEGLQALPTERARELLCAASLYASTKLSEVEARAHLVEELHGGARPI
jgi:hypothetical protein